MDEKTRQATRLWTLAQPQVSAFIASVVHDFGARDDVLQDVAVAVVDSFDTYDRERPFVTWAIGVARNQVRLYLRRVRRDRHVFDDDTVNCLATAFAEVQSVQTRKLDFLHECLALLEDRAKRICAMRYQDDIKPAAIGEAIGMSPNAVAKALQRIRDQLRSCIERKAVMEGLG